MEVGQEEWQIKELPQELLTRISENIIKGSKNFSDAVQNFKNFVQAIMKTKQIDLMSEDYDKKLVVNLMSSKFKVPFIIVAKKIGMELSDKLKKELKNLAIDRILKRHNITRDKLQEWYLINKDQLNIAFNRSLAQSKSESEVLLATAAALIYGTANLVDAHGHTALIASSAFGYKDIVEFLLNIGANPDIQDKEGKTAIIYAAISGHKDIVELLLNAGANPDLKDKKLKTALIYAVLKGNKDIVELLLKTKAKPDI